MMLSRRELLKSMTLGAGAGLVGGGVFALGASRMARAQAGRVLDVAVVGFSLGIHVPSMAAMKEILPTLPGYAAAKTTRFAS
ncbi:MAG TPA: hypothetical protein VF431_08940, partial [Candidatus Methylomirabilis sp.]